MNSRLLTRWIACVAATALLAGAALAAAKPYKLLKTVPIKGDGGWDYLTVDEAGRRVYVSHGSEVVILDADSYEEKGKIDGLKGVHGIAVATELGRGFISEGQANQVTIFDLKGLKKIGTVETGKNPDAILFDASCGKVFAFNGRDGTATVIEAKDGKVAGTIKLGGKPEGAVADGKGHVFVNLEDKAEVAKLDVAKLTVLERYPIKPGDTPVSLSIDLKNRRLFVGCRSKVLVVLDADSGKVVASQPIGERVDAGGFDPELGLVFNSCGDGTVSVIHQDGADKYTVVENAKTQLGSKTMALDTKTHKLFLPRVEYKPDPDNPKARPKVVPGTFAVLVFGQ
jgi:DNA-binding beta-propeller fold protein YncE